MQKKPTLVAAGIATLTGLLTAMPTFAEEEPLHIANLSTDVVISKINPAENWMEISYNKTSEAGAGRVYYLNIEYGEISDMWLRLMANSLGRAESGMMKIVYLGERFIDDGESIVIFGGEAVSSGRQNISLGEVAAGTGKLAMSTHLGYGVYVAQRIDFTRCINSSVYREGMTCVAEPRGAGEVVQYQPYDGAERVEIPTEETEALDKATYGEEFVEAEKAEAERAAEEAARLAEEERLAEEARKATEASASGNSENMGQNTDAENAVKNTETGAESARNGGFEASAWQNSESSEARSINRGRSAGYAYENRGGLADDTTERDAESTSKDKNVFGNATEIGVNTFAGEEEVKVPELGQKVKRNSVWEMLKVVGAMSLAAAALFFLLFGKRRKSNEKEDEESKLI